MKASKMIEELQGLITEYGDLEVTKESYQFDEDMGIYDSSSIYAVYQPLEPEDIYRNDNQEVADMKGVFVVSVNS